MSGSTRITSYNVCYTKLLRLNEVLDSAHLHLNCAAPRRENDGTYRIELYASPAESKKLIAMGYRNKVDDRNNFV